MDTSLHDKGEIHLRSVHPLNIFNKRLVFKNEERKTNQNMTNKKNCHIILAPWLNTEGSEGMPSITTVTN